MDPPQQQLPEFGSVFSEYLGHTHFFSNDSFIHGLIPIQ